MRAGMKRPRADDEDEDESEPEDEDVKPPTKRNGGGKKTTANAANSNAQAQDLDVIDTDPMDGEVDSKVYCTCRQVSYGEMIGCDDDECEIEWVSGLCSFCPIPSVDRVRARPRSSHCRRRFVWSCFARDLLLGWDQHAADATSTTCRVSVCPSRQRATGSVPSVPSGGRSSRKENVRPRDEGAASRSELGSCPCPCVRCIDRRCMNCIISSPYVFPRRLWSATAYPLSPTHTMSMARVYRSLLPGFVFPLPLDSSALSRKGTTVFLRRYTVNPNSYQSLTLSPYCKGHNHLQRRDDPLPSLPTSTALSSHHYTLPGMIAPRRAVFDSKPEKLLELLGRPCLRGAIGPLTRRVCLARSWSRGGRTVGGGVGRYAG
jgi:hypothetical protein